MWMCSIEDEIRPHCLLSVGQWRGHAESGRALPLAVLNTTNVSSRAAMSTVLNDMSSQFSATNSSWNIGYGWGIPDCTGYGHEVGKPVRKVICIQAKVHSWADVLFLIMISHHDNNLEFYGVWILHFAIFILSYSFPQQKVGMVRWKQSSSDEAEADTEI